MASQSLNTPGQLLKTVMNIIQRRCGVAVILASSTIVTPLLTHLHAAAAAAAAVVARKLVEFPSNSCYGLGSWDADWMRVGRALRSARVLLFVSQSQRTR